MTVFDDPATVPAPAGPYSHVARVELGDKVMLFLSGQIALDADGRLVGEGDMTAQSECVMETVAAILTAHGATLADVVNIRTYLADMDQRRAYGAVRTRYFTGTPPTSTTVEVSRLFFPGALLEVEVTAVV